MSVDDFVQKYGEPDYQTLRDTFALAALNGYLAAHADPETRLPVQREIAVWAYDMADEMLKAREKK
jgi:hypothetical protein